MKKQSWYALASLLSMTESPLAGADQLDVQHAEKQYKELVAKQETQTDRVAGQLFYLARVDQENGERANADRAFRQVLDSNKQSSASPAQIASLRQFWASKSITPSDKLPEAIRSETRRRNGKTGMARQGRLVRAFGSRQCGGSSEVCINWHWCRTLSLVEHALSLGNRTCKNVSRCRCPSRTWS